MTDRREYFAAYYREHRERILAYKKGRYQQILQQRQKYREANRLAIKISRELGVPIREAREMAG